MADLAQAISDVRTEEARTPEDRDLHAADGTTGSIDPVGRPDNRELGSELGEDGHRGAVATEHPKRRDPYAVRRSGERGKVHVLDQSHRLAPRVMRAKQNSMGLTANLPMIGT